MQLTPDIRPEEGKATPLLLNGGESQVLRAVSDGAGIVWLGSGVRASRGTPPAALDLEWEVFASDACETDDDPCAEGSTWCTPGIIRQGLLFQITGRRALAWYLRVTAPAGVYQVAGEIAWRSIPVECAGELVVLTGPLIG